MVARALRSARLRRLAVHLARHSAGLTHVIEHPSIALALFGLTAVSLAFHELGHAAACRYSGGRPGAIGVGVFVVWPAFYTDVTDSYRLPRAGRLRTDLGGMYFNAVFCLALVAAYLATGFEPLIWRSSRSTSSWSTSSSPGCASTATTS